MTQQMKYVIDISKLDAPFTVQKSYCNLICLSYFCFLSIIAAGQQRGTNRIHGTMNPEISEV